jgi:hypothetical protein
LTVLLATQFHISQLPDIGGRNVAENFPRRWESVQVEPKSDSLVKRMDRGIGKR